MTDLKLTVMHNLTSTGLSFPLAAGDFPDGVKGEIVGYSEDAIDVPVGRALLLVTDDEALARKALEKENDRLCAAFIGKAEALGDLWEKAEVIWDSDMSASVFKHRCLKLIEGLRSRFNEAFYKNVLLATIDTVPDMLWYKRFDGIYMYANDAFARFVHKDREDLIGKDHYYIWNAPKPEEGNEYACEDSERTAIESGKTYICDEPVRTYDGVKQLTTYKTPIYDPVGNVFGTVGIGHDVTNFANLGIELSILIEHLPYPMTIFTPDWKVVRMNTLFKEIVGTDSPEAFDYQEWKETVPTYVGKVQASDFSPVMSHECKLEVKGVLRDIVLTELEIHNRFNNISGYFCTLQDITFQRAYERSILSAANTDMLTGMFNRRYMYSCLEKLLDKPFHFLYLDLDRFKAINDHFGHNTGDKVLVETGQMIDRCFPNGITARLGGDEFAVIDRESSREEIDRRCSQLREELKGNFGQYGCGTTVSIGVAFNDGTYDNIDALIRCSDALMYDEKSKHHLN